MYSLTHTHTYTHLHTHRPNGPMCVCFRLVKWIESCVCDDPFLNPELMRANPWVEKGKCVIL